MVDRQLWSKIVIFDERFLADNFFEYRRRFDVMGKPTPKKEDNLIDCGGRFFFTLNLKGTKLETAKIFLG